MPIINSQVKPFKAQAYHNGDFVTVTEESLKGKWSVFVFYPADFTFVCPTELGDLADRYAEFQKLGVEIYSVSTDTHFTHKAWHDGHDPEDQVPDARRPDLGDLAQLRRADRRRRPGAAWHVRDQPGRRDQAVRSSRQRYRP